ncbi:helix-turn-helix transcriptional regulator [Erwinia sp. Eh17-17]|jgi:Ner family transcriptional regulator|uniref:helix-turn-helix domain-containing protein n=1 Tax=Erwinia sp. Eh17-17 TaxID=3080330 RepID=UPI0032091C0B
MKDDKDWHQAVIQAEIRKKGYSMASLSRENGLASGTLANALIRPWPKGELIISKALGVSPEKIWPSRYYKNNKLVKRLCRVKKSRHQDDT